MPIIKTQFPPSISVANLNGVNGFNITEFSPDSIGGVSVSGAGDVNGDGIADLIIGAPDAFNNAGASYVIFGKLGLGIPGSMSVSSLTGSNGFIISCSGICGLGSSVSGAGDVNGDGIADLIIGASYVSSSYVFFGQSGIGSSGSVSVLDLSGSNGFTISGFPAPIGSIVVSGAGDVNGDGIADLIIGAPNAFSNNAGAGYVIFGKSGLGSSGIMSVSSLSGSNGFVITGFPAHSYGGTSVSGAGDVNGDGIADLIIGAPDVSSGDGASYVLFGQSGIGSSGSMSVSSLTGIDGFIITGFSGGGYPVGGVGDVNGDGIADLIIGAILASGLAGASYVIFGKSGLGSSGSVSVLSLTGSNGFVITGFPADSLGGSSVSGAGDVNGDGIADLIIGAPDAFAFNSAGASYVLFGQSGIGNSGSVSVSDLPGSNGFAIVGFPASSRGGSSVSGAGDVNGDGLADLIIGAPSAFGSAGASYVIFGELLTSVVISRNQLTIKEDQALLLSSQNLNATNPQNSLKDSTLQFTVRGIQHGRFYSSTNPSLFLTSFTQKQVQNGQIYFAHDGSGWAPSYNVSVEYPGLFVVAVTPSQPATITFQQSFALMNNMLTIYQGQTVVLASNYLSANDLYNSANNPNLVFSINDIQYGYFALISATSIPITIFTQAQIQSGEVQFVQDGSINSPSYNVVVINGAASISEQPAMITFRQSLVLVNNTLKINQGQVVVLISSYLCANDLYNSANNPNLVFLVSNVQHGYFALKSLPSTAITTFSQSQIQNADVQFVQDGSINPPSYYVTVIDGAASIPAQAATISFDALPVFINNNLTINQGQTVVLSATNLSAINPYYPGASLTFTVSNVRYGQFEFVSNPGVSITSFTQVQVENDEVQFVHDGSANAPSYSLTASDGRASTTNAGTIFFDATPVITWNALTVNQGQKIILNYNNLGAINPYKSQVDLIFTIRNIQHGQFELTDNPGVAITHFIQKRMQNGTVLFVHDGSVSAPRFNVVINNSSSTLRPNMIIFNVLPNLDRNVITLQQGETITLRPENLHSTYLANSDPQLTFVIDNVQNGYFALNSSSQTITRFTQGQVQSGTVQLISDGGIIPPSFVVAVRDGVSISSPQIGVVNFTPLLLLVNNTLLISKQGQTIVFSDAQLGAVNPGNSTSSLGFTVSNVQHGFFSLVSRPSTAITRFTQQQVQQAKVQFNHDGSSSASSYQVTVTDGMQITPPESSRVIFNLAPQFQTNRLSVSSGGFVILSSNELSATDPDDPAEQLVFTVSQVQHGAFTFTHDQHLSLKNFTQAQVQAGDITFLTDGGFEAPSYLIGVSDGYSTMISNPEITFISPNSALAVDEATVRNAIYGGTASGIVGLLFFFVQLYLNRRMTKNLLDLEKMRETEIEKQQADYYKHAVKPIVERLFTEVDTTIICGYRSEKDTLHYQAAVERIVNHLVKLDRSVDTREMSPAQYFQLRNQIIDQIKKQTKKDYKCCSKAYCCHFFKPEISAEELEDQATAIANAVSSALPRITTSSASSGSSKFNLRGRAKIDIEPAATSFHTADRQAFNISQIGHV